MPPERNVVPLDSLLVSGSRSKEEPSLLRKSKICSTSLAKLPINLVLKLSRFSWKMLFYITNLVLSCNTHSGERKDMLEIVYGKVWLEIHSNYLNCAFQPFFLVLLTQCNSII